MAVHGKRLVHRGEHVLDFAFDEIAQAGAVSRSILHRGEDPLRCGDAHVGRDQQLLERVDRLDIDRTRSTRGLVGGPHELVEALGDLLLGAGETFTDAAKE